MFVKILYIFPRLVYCVKKNLATLVVTRNDQFSSAACLLEKKQENLFAPKMKFVLTLLVCAFLPCSPTAISDHFHSAKKQLQDIFENSVCRLQDPSNATSR
jgi:hypothetical protein